MIVIKTDELNYLIYRYFLEQGLQHSAFALCNEAGVKEYASKYQDEVRPGHLINLLEKSLLF
jgi:transducin (beta)-like 1